MALDQAYWEQRYQEGATGWDAGEPTRPITDYVDQLDNKHLKILIPGAGNGYEAEYLFNQGFEQVHVMDLAQQPLDNLKKRVPDFPEAQLIQENFFDHKEAYDIILEQTFFCVINPSLRPNYAVKAKELLKPGGKLVGVLWSAPMNTDGPPYGGSINEYGELFDSHFEIEVLAPCYNSIKPRMGREVFMILQKPD